MTTKTRSPEDPGPQARAGKRAADEIRPILIRTDYFENADGSAYIEMGKTKVAASATLDDQVPPFLKGTGTGWVTAEYAMLPCATERRTPRERMPGQGLGADPGDPAAHRPVAPERHRPRGHRRDAPILIDCDVLQADGGTRAASVTAGCVALALALKKLLDLRYVKAMPLKHLVAAVSVGARQGPGAPRPRLQRGFRRPTST